jgi:hypothetical protein
MNMYSYVSNNPVNSLDPSGLYEIDVHHDMPLFLAMETGCFSNAQAKKIADGDQQTDVLDEYSPGPMKEFQNEHYHALHPGSHAPYLRRLWARAVEGNGNLEWLGRYLHYLQDTYSHEGYTNSDWGHSPVSALFFDKPGTHATDKTDSDVEKAMRMAEDTWNALKIFAIEKHCQCDYNKSFDSVRDRIRRFAEAPSGNFFERRVNTLDEPSMREYLENKRLILGLPPE